MSNILQEVKNNIAYITINRPEKLNALNRETIAELGKAIQEADQNPEVKVMILTGAGDKAFVAGADISEFNQYSVAEGKEMAENGHKTLFDVAENSRTPIIAAVNGFALGGGLELAMACHIRIASENAKMGLPEVGLGVIPGYGGTQRLAQLAGKGKAYEMIFTAGMIKAEEALEIGLVNQLSTQVELMSSCEAMAAKIMKNSPLAIGAAITAINAGFRSDKNGYQTEIDEFGKTFQSEDFKEGTTAFLEKRKPNFTGK
ncbi:MAG: enoyl-CoA hydratase-related protein [Vicingaceae bacterium]